MGVCAGAYLCTSHYSWSLHLINASVFNKTVEIPGQGRKSMWFRGPPADIDVEVLGEGAEVLGIEGTHTIRYHNGPILSVGKNPELPAYKTLASFRGENGLYKAQENTMQDTPAVVSALYGKGRILVISPHFESTPGMDEVILRAIGHVCPTVSN